MTPRMRNQARAIVRETNQAQGQVAIWMTSDGEALIHAEKFPSIGTIKQKRRVGHYVAPIALPDVLDDIEHVLDEMQVPVKISHKARAA